MFLDAQDQKQRGAADGERNLGLGCLVMRGGRQLGRSVQSRQRFAATRRTWAGCWLRVPGSPRPGAAWGCRAGLRGHERVVRGESRGPTLKPSPGCTEEGPTVSPRTRRECEFGTAGPRCGCPLSTRVPGLPPPLRSLPEPSPLLSGMKTPWLSETTPPASCQARSSRPEPDAGLFSLLPCYDTSRGKGPPGSPWRAVAEGTAGLL